MWTYVRHFFLVASAHGGLARLVVLRVTGSASLSCICALLLKELRWVGGGGEEPKLSKGRH